MFYRWRTKFAKSRFNAQIADILKTPPIRLEDAPWAIISMVSNSDVPMYLLSMKSFYTRLKRGKIIAIVDRDMPADLRRTLSEHFIGIEFAILEDIDTGSCQRGGTWERLVYLLDHADKEYAIQVDCDTLAFGADVDEVIRCAESNTAFTLSNAGRPIETMIEIAADAKKMDSDYVGIVVERLFDRYPDCASKKYVRASSGFAGFARGGFPRAEIEVFHREMRKLLPDRWHQWGTEQNGSNFAVANSPNAAILPWPKYANFWEGLERGRSSFLHFIGSSRYLDGYFAAQGQRIIAELMKRG